LDRLAYSYKDLIAIRYLEAMERIAQGQAIKIFLPYEASGILGSLAGIAEILKQRREGQV